MSQPSLLQIIANRLGYIALRATRACLLVLGLERASGFMGWCWRSFAPWTKRHPRAMAQLAAAMPELSASERRAILLAMWDGLGRTFAEGLLLDKLLAAPERVRLENETLAAELQADGGPGTVFVSMHAGNWEALGVPLATRGFRVAGLYQAVQNPLVERYLLALREQLYLGGMISKRSHGMTRIVRLLRSGDAVAMLADQRQAGRGVPVTFFGAEAPSTPLPATLALRTSARLVLVRCRREGPVRYAIDLQELDVAPSGDHEADVTRLSQAIHSQFESWIRERPQEWMWAHRRWSRAVRTPDDASDAPS